MNCKFRYQHIHPLKKCSVSLAEDDLNVLHTTLESPLRCMTSGQYSVFYVDEECLGSAQILKPGPSLYALNNNDTVKNSQ